MQLLVALTLICLANSAQAQRNYNTSIGLRLGYTSGLTVKGFINDKIALEGIVSTRLWGSRGWGANTLLLTGLIEWNFPIRGVQGLNWLVGGGLHIGFYNDQYNNQGSGGTYVGLDFIGGLEYTLPTAPFTFQLDLKPAIHVLGNSDFWYGDFAISVRYAF